MNWLTLIIVSLMAESSQFSDTVNTWGQVGIIAGIVWAIIAIFLVLMSAVSNA